MKKTTMYLLLAMALSSPAFAAGDKMGSDNDFAMKAADGGMAEVQTGQMAANKGSDPKIKQFGQRMVQDHGTANKELKSIASKDNISLPQSVSDKHKSAADKLAKLSGKDFDNEYAQMMVKDHEEDVALFQKEANSGSNPELKAFAQKTLPTLQEHLRMAQQLPGASGSDHSNSH
ncbi:MAG TPA: DUF4142 domain-containing protein [Rudaea sp.]